MLRTLTPCVHECDHAVNVGGLGSPPGCDLEPACRDGPPSDRRQRSIGAGFGRGQGFTTRADAMTTHLPAIPALRCVGCGGERFIPLTFPRLRLANRIEQVLRPSAKCVTCGQCYFGAPNLPINPSASAHKREDDRGAVISLRGRRALGVAGPLSLR